MTIEELVSKLKGYDKNTIVSTYSEYSYPSEITSIHTENVRGETYLVFGPFSESEECCEDE